MTRRTHTTVTRDNFRTIGDLKKLDLNSGPAPDPYGIWRCADGTELLFDRSYTAIWIKHPDGSVKRTAGYPDNLVHEELFWCDGPTQPERSWKARRKLDCILREWGLE
jgi:hypothetical protein